MNFFPVLLFCLVFALSVVNADASSEFATVEALKGSEQFDDFVEKHQVSFIKFYAPWCGHCKKLEPTWDRLAEEVGSKKIGIAKVDVEDGNRRLAAKYGVKGFPTLRLIEGEKLYDKYKGMRDLASLKTYVEGGYKNSNYTAVPKSGSMIEEWQKSIEDFTTKVVVEGTDLARNIMKVAKEDPGVLLFFIAFGFLMGKLLDMCMPGQGRIRAWRQAEKELKEEEAAAKKNK